MITALCIREIAVRRQRPPTWSSSDTPSSLGIPDCPHNSKVTLASEVVGGVWFSLVVVRNPASGVRSYDAEATSNMHSKGFTGKAWNKSAKTAHLLVLNMMDESQVRE